MRFKFFIVFCAAVIKFVDGSGDEKTVFSSGPGESEIDFKFDHVDDVYDDGVKKLIIDTDAGSDDGVAILNILGAQHFTGKVKTLFFTTVVGNTHVDNVGRNVLKILKTAKKLEIPVFRGSNHSILVTPECDNFFGEDGFGDFYFPDPPPEDLIRKEHAANALVKAVSENPGKLTLVCLGPLTNVALAIRLDPTFLENLKDIYVLGGSDSGMGNIKPGIEFNFYVDPEAAFITFKEAEVKKKKLNLVTWETVSVRSTIDLDWRLNELGKIESPEVDLINKAEHEHLKGKNWNSADTILSAVVVDDKIVDSAKEYHMDVEVGGTFSRGAVFVDHEQDKSLFKNVVLIERINIDEYKKMLLHNFSVKKDETNGASSLRFL